MYIRGFDHRHVGRLTTTLQPQAKLLLDGGEAQHAEIP